MSKQRVLVLNQDYSPIAVCSIERAFLLVFLEKAELLAAAIGQQLNTISHSYPMPSVIRLYRYIHVPYKGVVLTRQNIFKRDGFQCQYCGTTRDLSLDHIIPSSKGGESSWTNLVTACKRCNARKGDQSPEQAGMKLAKKPIKPSYVMFLRDFSGQQNPEWMPFLGKTKSVKELD